MRFAFLVATLAMAACSSSSTAPATPSPDASPGSDAATSDAGSPALGQTEHGDGTYYAADGSGNCSFDPSPNDLLVAAMDAPLYAGSAVCGECVAITGPKGQVTVRIVDQCPGCKAGDLDLSPQAFGMIADLSAGRVPISWNVVPCNVQGNVAYRFKEGSNAYWTAIQVRNHRLPIAKLEWMKGGAWVELPRQDYNYFVDANGTGSAGFAVRVTAIDGQTLTDMLPAVSPGLVVTGAGQFH
jgi:expansin (peptidoglycan-binding protein)